MANSDCIHAGEENSEGFFITKLVKTEKDPAQ